MPEMTPVGNQIKPPDVLGNLSNMLGIKQQQQQLVTGQSIQQEAQQRARQMSMDTQAKQGVQDFFKDYYPADHMSDDGTVDLESVYGSKAFKNLNGLAKENVIESMQNIKAKGLENKQTLAKLNGTLVNQFDTQVGVVADDKDVIADNANGRAKAKSMIDLFARQGPDAARIADLYGPYIDKIPSGKLHDALRSMQMQAQSASDQIATTTPRPTFVQTGDGEQGVNTNPNAAMPVGTPMGSPVMNAAPPGITLDAQGVPRYYGPGGKGLPQAGGGRAAPAAPEGKLQPLQRPAPFAPKVDQDNYNAQIATAREAVTTARGVANDPMNGVQSTRFRNQQIIDLIPHATTGPGTRLLNTLASRLPGASGDAYQDLEHYTAQNSAALAKAMGVPGTNMGAETAAAAAGNVERNPGALMEITKTNDALNTAFDLYNRGLQKVSNNGNDPSRVNAYQQAFGQALDINAMRWADAHRRGDKAEQDAIAKKVGKAGMARINQSLRTIKALADTGDLP